MLGGKSAGYECADPIYLLYGTINVREFSPCFQQWNDGFLYLFISTPSCCSSRSLIPWARKTRTGSETSSHCQYVDGVEHIVYQQRA
jgi:hypothetical protein